METKLRGRKPDVKMILAVKELRGRGLSISQIVEQLQKGTERPIYRRSVLRWMKY